MCLKIVELGGAIQTESGLLHRSVIRRPKGAADLNIDRQVQPDRRACSKDTFRSAIR
jgi:hypothetical protein